MRSKSAAALVVLLSVCATTAAAAAEIPPELTKPNYRIRQVTGIGPQRDVARQDPSNVIKVG